MEWSDMDLLIKAAGEHAKQFVEKQNNIQPELVGPWIRLALVHTELSEAMEILRDAKCLEDLRRVWFEYEIEGEKVEASTPTVRGISGTEYQGKPAGYAVELADAVIRIFALSEAEGLPLADWIARKIAFNTTRAPMHGRGA